jgi:hypothetical protein
MWPSIFGPGWGWGVLVVLAFLCLVLGVLGFLLLVINRPPRDPDESTDRLWHLLEEGDITPGEFERRKRAIQPKLGVRVVSK